MADESVIESGFDQIVAEDKKQSKSDSGKEEVAPATETDSDAFDPSPVVTESDVTSSELAPQRNIR